MKKPFLTLAQAREIRETYPTPFHIYDERGIRENARAPASPQAERTGYSPTSQAVDGFFSRQIAGAALAPLRLCVSAGNKKACRGNTTRRAGTVEKRHYRISILRGLTSARFSISIRNSPFSTEALMVESSAMSGRSMVQA